MAFCTTCGAKVSGAFCTHCGTPLGVAGQQPPAQATPPAQPPSYQAPAYQAAPPPAAPAVMQGQRKTSPIVWVLIVILGLFVLGAIGVVGTGLFVAHKFHEAGIDPEMWHTNPGLAASKMITAFNPNMEMVRINEGDRTVTMRDKRNGHEWTMSFGDVQQGRFRMNMRDDNGGSVQIGGDASRLPAWIPEYPGSKPDVAFTGSSDRGEGGTFTFNTPDAPQDVMKFYQDKIGELGMKANLVANSIEGGTIVATEENGRSLNITVAASGGRTGVTVIYGRK